jgi:hypothetical protein
MRWSVVDFWGQGIHMKHLEFSFQSGHRRRSVVVLIQGKKYILNSSIVVEEGHSYQSGTFWNRAEEDIRRYLWGFGWHT